MVATVVVVVGVVEVEVVEVVVVVVVVNVVSTRPDEVVGGVTWVHPAIAMAMTTISARCFIELPPRPCVALLEG